MIIIHRSKHLMFFSLPANLFCWSLFINDVSALLDRRLGVEHAPKHQRNINIYYSAPAPRWEMNEAVCLSSLFYL